MGLFIFFSGFGDVFLYVLVTNLLSDVCEDLSVCKEFLCLDAGFFFCAEGT